MTEIFTMDTFLGHVGTRFLMHYGDSKTAELKLINVSDVGSSPRQIQFSLVFQGPADAPIAQGIYRIEHDALGALDLFLVPIGKDHTGVRYEAIFNRVLD